MTTKKIIITGNHHTPAIEFINQLKNDHRYNWKIHYITSRDRFENHVDNSLKNIIGDKLYQIDSGKYHRYSISKTLFDIPKTVKSFIQINRLTRKINPNLVVSFGGYISVPVVVSAWINKIKSITHEQTRTFSLSTILNGFFVNKICLSYSDLEVPYLFRKKAIYTGYLLRRQIYERKTKNYQHLVKEVKNKPLIFVSGGNQSSQIINLNFLRIIDKLLDKYIIIHHIGKYQYDIPKHPNYYATVYVGLEDIGWVLNNSNIVINRAGANYCQEIASLGIKSILIPLSISQQNEQLKNAAWLKQKLPDQTIVIPEQLLTPKKLYQAIVKLSLSPNPKTNVSHKQNRRLIELVHRYV